MILKGADKDICEWVSEGLFGVRGMFENSIGIGITKDKRLIAGVIYNNQYCDPYGKPYSIEMSIYTIDKRWCTRHNLRTLFGISFTQLDLRRVQTTCSANEGKAIMFNKRLGFIQEGIHRAAHPTGADTISFGMLKSDCRWL